MFKIYNIQAPATKTIAQQGSTQCQHAKDI